MKAMSRHAKAATALGAGLMLLLTACGGSGGGGDAGGDGELSGANLSVGSKEFTESIVLAQITAVALENAGAKVEDKTGISGSATVREALESKQIDMYWDYTGTGWVNILGNTTKEAPKDLYDAVSKADAKNGIAWLEPAPFDDTYRIAVPKAFSEEHGITTMSQAADYIKEHPDDSNVCAASEFINRDDGLPGLEKAYGFTFGKTVELDLNLIYTQIGESCSFGEVFSTDARVVSNDLTVLDDDKKFFVEYQGSLTLRQETLDQYPAIAEIMKPVSEALTNDVITELNGKVDNDGEQPRDVAEDWLKDAGLVD